MTHANKRPRGAQAADPSATPDAPKRLENVSVRLNELTIARLDALADVLRRPGRRPITSDAMLATIYAGLKAFEQDPSLIERAKTKKP